MKESVTKKRILEVASRLFYKQGYNSTGINQIIEEAAIARGSLYNHFPSKRDLLTAYIQDMEAFTFMEWDDLLKSVKDPKQKILKLFDISMLRQMRSDFGGCAFIKIAAEIPYDDLLAFDLVCHQKKATKIYIENLLQQINITKPHAFNKEMLANTLFFLLEGATITSTIVKNNQALIEAKEIAESFL